MKRKIVFNYFIDFIGYYDNKIIQEYNTDKDFSAFDYLNNNNFNFIIPPKCSRILVEIWNMDLLNPSPISNLTYVWDLMDKTELEKKLRELAKEMSIYKDEDDFLWEQAANKWNWLLVHDYDLGIKILKEYNIMNGE